MRVLVTGASGFLGRHVVAKLLADGHRVRALVLPSDDTSELGWPVEKVDVFRADLRESQELGQAFDGVDVLVHLAAAMSGGQSEMMASTVGGTQRLLEAMAESSVGRVVLAGSFSVYDWSRVGDTITESSPLEGDRVCERDAYTLTKLQQETLVRRMSAEHGWALTVLRPGAVWGPGRVDLPEVGHRVGPLYLVIAPRGPLRITYVENCAAAFCRAAVVPSAPERTLNVLDDERISAWAFSGRLAQIRARASLRIPIPYLLARLAPAIASATHRWVLRGRGRLPGILTPRQFEARFRRVEYRNDAAKRQLEWTPAYSFSQALGRIIEGNGERRNG